METSKPIKFTLEIDPTVHQLMRLASATHKVSMKDIVVKAILKEIALMQKEPNEKN